MADFSSYLSDTDESAVDELISQAEDLVALDHLSALNLSSHSSLLPSDLESRFQNLKSFPPRIPISSPSRHGVRKPDRGAGGGELRSKSDLMGERGSGCERKLGLGSDAELNDEREGGFGKKSELGKMGKHKGGRDGSSDSGSNSSGSFEKDAIFMPRKANPVAEIGNPMVKSKRGTLSGGSGFNRGLGSDSSPSPPRKGGGCFWCSPKKKSPRKNKDLDMDLGWGKHEELLSDLGSFSAKEQRRVLKEAMKEQERLSKEAEKIVRIAKQASARMQVHGDSSDDETKL